MRVSIILIGLAWLATPVFAAPPPKVEICHIPPGNPDNFHTITISVNALAAHLAHGDLSGACAAPTCGNGFIDGNDDCDGSDLDGATCESLGFQGGTLACSAGCGLDVSGCNPFAAPASGQTIPFTIGDDGDIQSGAPLAYSDNGDGTITDLNTGLMWEKKVGLNFVPDPSNLNDADNCYPRLGTCSTAATVCGTDADCPGVETCDAGDCQQSSPDGLTIFEWIVKLNTAAFAGHTDWRVPNIKELQGIVIYGAGVDPPVAPVFSPTRREKYWSSTATLGGDGWFVLFRFQMVTSIEGFSDRLYVRAVRGGL